MRTSIARYVRRVEKGNDVGPIPHLRAALETAAEIGRLDSATHLVINRSLATPSEWILPIPHACSSGRTVDHVCDINAAGWPHCLPPRIETISNIVGVR